MKLTVKWRHVRRLAAKLHSDGCTGVPDLWFSDCCRQHDIEYRTGRTWRGRATSRWQADWRLARCVYQRAITPIDRYVGSLMIWIGVRVLGARAWNRNQMNVG